MFRFQMIMLSDVSVFCLVPVIPLCCSAFLLPFTNFSFIIPCCSSFLVPFNISFSSYFPLLPCLLVSPLIIFLLLLLSASLSSCSNLLFFPFLFPSIIIQFCLVILFFLSLYIIPDPLFPIHFFLFLFPAASLSPCFLYISYILIP